MFPLGFSPDTKVILVATEFLETFSTAHTVAVLSKEQGAL